MDLKHTNDLILIMLDHPFQFFIQDKLEELVLFEGRLGVRENLETEPTEALMDMKQSDGNFWWKVFGVKPVDPLIVAV